MCVGGGGARVRVGACVRAHACACVRRFVRARARDVFAIYDNII